MRIKATSPSAVSPLVVAGACTLATDSLDETLDAADWFSTDLQEAGFEIELHGLSLADFGEAVSAAVTELFSSQPELANWTWHLEDEAENDTNAEDDPDGDAEPARAGDPIDDLANDLIGELERTLRSSARLMALAPHFQAIDLDELFGIDGDGSARSSVDERRMLAGTLITAALIVEDELHHDAAYLRGSRADLDETMVLWNLPERFRHRYNPIFTQQLAVVFADLTRQIQNGWETPSCVAQELCVRLWLNQAEVLEDEYDIPLPEDWKVLLEDVLFEDLDHEYLFDPAADGFEDDPDFGPAGMARMRFEDWFRPFNSHRFVPLYALPLDEEATQGSREP